VFKRIVVGAIVSIITTSAIAEGYVPAYISEMAPALHTGIYMTANVMYSRLALAKNATVQAAGSGGTPIYSSKMKQSFIGGSFFVGYNAALRGTNLLLGTELGLIYFGQLRFSAGTAITPGSYPLGAAAALLSLHVGQGPWDYFAKGGVAAESSGSQAIGSGTEKYYNYNFKEKVTPMVVAGFGYSVDQHWRAVVQADYIFGREIISDDMGSGIKGTPARNKPFRYMTIGLGLSYQF